jgi:hypothetical protein
LTLAQMTELAGDGVISQDTYVWRNGMSDWTQAMNVADLRASLGIAQSELYPPARQIATPPPTPMGSRAISPAAPDPFTTYSVHSQTGWQYIQTHAPKSDKSRVTGGLLNFIPGVGRLYLGYMAHGILQLFTFLFCGIGLIWAWIDAIYILAGGVRLDGYGRRLDD